jgi:hypothetical protein
VLRESSLTRHTTRSAVDFTVVDGAREALAGGKRTPVLGCGIFGQGPLSSHAIVSALRESKPNSLRQDRMALATAAEYYERKFLRVEFWRLSRESFASNLRKLRVLQSSTF